MCCFMMTDHVPSYQTILNHAYWYWVLAWAICCFMMTDHVPSYQSIPPSPILNHTYWCWASVLAMCCFMVTDHVISHHPPSSILNHVYTYIHTCIYPNIYLYIYIYTYVYMKNPIPNTQFPKRISKDPVSANILPEYWPIMELRCDWTCIQGSTDSSVFKCSTS